MATSDVLTAEQLRAAFGVAEQWLTRNRDAINAINVYPVPDGDTGTNMVMTVREVLDALEDLAADAPRDDLCATITRSAMRGARGNSGVILSQVLRALAEAVVETDGPLGLAEFGSFLRRSRDLAYRAVAEPVEGTILTVIGVASEMAQPVVLAQQPMQHPTSDGQPVGVTHVLDQREVVGGAERHAKGIGHHDLAVIRQAATGDPCSGEYAVTTHPLSSRRRATSA